MDIDLAQEAIVCALNAEWRKAVELNLKILSKEAQNIDALNRLARAYSEVGKTSLAKKTTKEVLRLDPFNSIALKATEKWKVLKKGQSYNSNPAKADVFLEEPGKTKVVSLMHLGDSNLLVKLDAGDKVNLDHHSHRINVLTPDGKYIGRLPDDLSARIKKLISWGNSYQAHVKSADKNEIKVFIRETVRAEKLSDTPSFPTEKLDYVSFTPPELVHDKTELEIPQEEDQ